MKTKLPANQWKNISDTLLNIGNLQSPMVQIEEKKMEQRKDPVRLSGKASVRIRRVIAKIDEYLKPVFATIDDIVKNIPPAELAAANEKPPVKSAAVLDAEKKKSEAMAEEIEIEFDPIIESMLDLDRNNIPVNMLFVIDPVLENDQAKAK